MQPTTQTATTEPQGAVSRSAGGAFFNQKETTTMRAPDLELGQGVRRRCVVCGQLLSIQGRGRFKGRARKYCSRHCADEAFRHPAVFRATPSPSEGLRERCPKSSNKSDTSRATFDDRASAFKPVLRVVAGPPVSDANLLLPYRGFPPRLLDHQEREDLVKRARELEFAARWPTGGLK
jgi:hypothetical protein